MRSRHEGGWRFQRFSVNQTLDSIKCVLILLRRLRAWLVIHLHHEILIARSPLERALIFVASSFICFFFHAERNRAEWQGGGRKRKDKWRRKGEGKVT